MRPIRMTRLRPRRGVGGLSNRIRHMLNAGILGNAQDSARLENRLGDGAFFKADGTNDLHLRKMRPDRACQLRYVGMGQRYVDQQHIGGQAITFAKQVEAVARFADPFQIPEDAHESVQAETHRLRIVYDQYPDGSFSGHRTIHRIVDTLKC